MNVRNWNRRFLVLLLALLAPLALILALSLRGFARDAILIPLSYTFWIAGILIRSTPQALFWGLLIAVGLILAVRSLWVVAKMPDLPGEGELSPPRRQRVGFWIFQMYLSHEGYSRVRFADFFSRLALEILAFREGVDPVEAERRLQSGEMETAPEILDFLRAGRISSPAEGRGGFLPWMARRLHMWKERLVARRDGGRAAASNTGLEEALQYLEDQLEVKHDV